MNDITLIKGINDLIDKSNDLPSSLKPGYLLALADLTRLCRQLAMSDLRDTADKLDGLNDAGKFYTNEEKFSARIL